MKKRNPKSVKKNKNLYGSKILSGESLNIKKENLKKLRELFPNIFSEDKLDLDKFKSVFTDDINIENERYVLNWAGKSDAFKVLQIPTSATLVPQPDESVNFDNTENVFIEGENLEVLKVLQKSYYGRIKCIIIDPPYNTGNDSFIYPDKFKESKNEYAKRTGELDEEGNLMKEGMFRKNTKDSGHFHSNWLSMMYPRLFLAKNLLKEDGVIFVHIDDNEVHNLRLIMNEIFGEENFVAQIIWERAYSPINMKKHFSESHDYIICFSNQFEKTSCIGLKRTDEANNRYMNPDKDKRGSWKSSDLSVGPIVNSKVYQIKTPSGRKVFPPSGRCWVYTKERFQELLADNRIWFGSDGNSVPSVKKFLSEVKDGITPMTLWKYNDVGHSQEAAQYLKKLFEGKDFFDYPKPVNLIKRCIELYSSNKDFILDFFAGSGTTAQAVLELNKEDGGKRKFILVQLPEKCDENSEAYKAGYETIADIAKERIRRVIKKIKKETTQLKLSDEVSPPDLGFKVFKLSPSNFKIWRGNGINEKELVKQLEAFTNPLKEGKQKSDILYEIILKAGYMLTDKIEKKDKYYSVKDGELIIALEEMSKKIIEKIISAKPHKVITLDILFKGKDQLKTNTALQMRDAEIEFKTI